MNPALYTCNVACKTCKRPLAKIVNQTIEAIVDTPDGMPANLRRTPDGDVVGPLMPGWVLPIVGAQEGAWIPVEWRGVQGWVRADLVRYDSEATRTAPHLAYCPEHTENVNIDLAWETQGGVLTTPAAAPPVPPVPVAAAAPVAAEKPVEEPKEEPKAVANGAAPIEAPAEAIS